MTNEKPQLDTPLILLDWVIIDDNLKKNSKKFKQKTWTEYFNKAWNNMIIMSTFMVAYTYMIYIKKPNVSRF